MCFRNVGWNSPTNPSYVFENNQVQSVTGLIFSNRPMLNGSSGVASLVEMEFAMEHPIIPPPMMDTSVNLGTVVQEVFPRPLPVQ